MLQLIQQLKQTYSFRQKGLNKFRAKVKIEFSMGPYLVKTAQSREELFECFKLRDHVFNKEFRGLSNTEFDFDEFDSVCDHIIIIHSLTSQVIGTYRLNSSLFSNNFYSQTEFDIKNFKYLKGPVLELGRACIHKDHRKGSVMTLLWRGIAEYMNASNSKTLFGCSSVKITDSREAALIYLYLKEKHLLDLRYLAKPQPSYEMDGFSTWLEYLSENLTDQHLIEAEELIPSLLRSYIKIGAKIIAEPAFDQDFNCVDFLTLLDRDQLSLSAEKKFGVNR